MTSMTLFSGVSANPGLDASRRRGPMRNPGALVRHSSALVGTRRHSSALVRRVVTVGACSTHWAAWPSECRSIRYMGGAYIPDRARDLWRPGKTLASPPSLEDVRFPEMGTPSVDFPTFQWRVTGFQPSTQAIEGHVHVHAYRVVHDELASSFFEISNLRSSRRTPPPAERSTHSGCVGIVADWLWRTRIRGRPTPRARPPRPPSTRTPARLPSRRRRR